MPKRHDWDNGDINYYNGYSEHETNSIYVDERERFVVSLIVGYSDEEAATAEEAAYYAVELTRDEGAGDTVWFVYDRKEQRMHQFEQSQFDTEVS